MNHDVATLQTLIISVHKEELETNNSPWLEYLERIVLDAVNLHICINDGLNSKKIYIFVF